MNHKSPESLPRTSRGFIDVPKIISDGKVHSFFPGFLPDIEAIRKRDFPLFEKSGRVYLDSGATSQEPKTVIERMNEHRLGQLRGSNHSRNSLEARIAQEEYLSAKRKIMNFFHAYNHSIAFTSGTTGSSNLLATRFDYAPNTLVLVTEAEHNSQIVTARNFAFASGSKFAILPVYKDGSLKLNVLNEIVNIHTGVILLNLIHSSNVTGTINDVKRIREIAGGRAYIYLDMAQSAGHIPIDLDNLGVDFAGVSAHKMYGPTGIGAFFASRRGERKLTNLVSGGGAVDLVAKNQTAYSKGTERFEPGTQNLEGAIEWGFVIDYLSNIGMDKIAAHDAELEQYFRGELGNIPGIVSYSPQTNSNRVPIFVFNSDFFQYDALAQRLDEKGISVRDGCFCAHLLMSKLFGFPPEFMDAKAESFNIFGGNKDYLPGAVRVSFAFYNNLQDAHAAITALDEIASSW